MWHLFMCSKYNGIETASINERTSETIVVGPYEESGGEVGCFGANREICGGEVEILFEGGQEEA